MTWPSGYDAGNLPQGREGLLAIGATRGGGLLFGAGEVEEISEPIDRLFQQFPHEALRRFSVATASDLNVEDKALGVDPPARADVSCPRGESKRHLLTRDEVRRRMWAESSPS